MDQFAQLLELSEAQNGIFKTADVLEKGISKDTLAEFVEKYAYERVSHGLYLSPDAWEDDFYLNQVRWPKSIFSHDTALYFLDLTDRDPLTFTVTVPTGYNASNLRAKGIHVFSVKEELFLMGKMKVKTPFGNTVSIYNAERTICDLVRNRSQMEIGIYVGALQRYAERKDKNIHRLMLYAKELRVHKLVQHYMELLLK